MVIVITLLGVITLTLKVRSDQVRKAIDQAKAEESIQLDEELKKKAAAAEKLAAAATAKHALAERELAETKRLAAELEEVKRKAAEVEETQRPRTISKECVDIFQATLGKSPRGKIEIIRVADDAETVAFSESVKALLSGVGFSVDRIHNFIPIGRSSPGIAIGVAVPEKAPPHAGHLQQAFQAAGLGGGGVQWGPDDKPDVVFILVGPKPLAGPKPQASP